MKDEAGSLQTLSNSNGEARRHGIAAVREVETAFASTSDLGVVLEILASKIQPFLPYPDTVVVIMLVNTDEGFEVAVVRNLEKEQEEWHRQHWSAFTREVLEHGAQHGAPLAIDDLQAYDPATNKDILALSGWASCLGVPLIGEGQRFGAILIYTRKAHRFGPEDSEILTAFGLQAVAAIRRCRVHEEAQRRVTELERENLVKDKLLGALSTDLRGPLSSVMGYAAMIQDGMLGQLNPKQETALAAVMKSCQDQLRLVNGALEVVKMEALKEKVLNGSRGLTEAVEEFEREVVLKALEKTGFNQTKTAKLLGITRRILRYKLDKLKLPKAL